MWRNADVLDFVGWLRAHNDALPADAHRSASTASTSTACTRRCSAVLDLSRQGRPRSGAARPRALRLLRSVRRRPAGVRLRRRHGLQPTRASARSWRSSSSCSQRGRDMRAATAASPRTSCFYAEQNARLVRNAEDYYRTMFRGRVDSWNLRDRAHGGDARRRSSPSSSAGGATRRVVVWAHNSHVGDARATEMGERGELNVGQLVRERYGAEPCSSASRRTPAR